MPAYMSLSLIIYLTFVATSYLTQTIPDVSYGFEEMRSAPISQHLRPLVASLAENSHNSVIISALMYVVPSVVKLKLPWTPSEHLR